MVGGAQVGADESAGPGRRGRGAATSSNAGNRLHSCYQLNSSAKPSFIIFSPINILLFLHPLSPHSFASTLDFKTHIQLIDAAPTEKLVENIDAVWDDGVAPEMCLDFDCQHVDSTEGLMWWLGGFTFFATVYQVVKATRPEDKKPCVNRIHNDMVVVGNPATGKLPGSSNVV